MSRDPNLHIPEIEVIEERKEEYRKKILEILGSLPDKLGENEAKIEAEKIIEIMCDYAQEKIDQIFIQENGRRGGKMLVRGEDGVGLVDKETI